jgi:hypothetical membrane protein
MTPPATDRHRDAALVALAVAAPVVLVGGGLLAEAAQPPGSYDPVGQTVSTLAGLGATDRWIMAAALAFAGVVYVLVAAGLRGVGRVARLVLGVGGVAVVVAALAAQPVHGSSPLHMTATVIGAVAFVLWPLPLAADPALDPALRRGSLVASGAMAVALAWLCAQAWTDGTWLGVAERVLLLSETVWPLRVAIASWRGVRRRPWGEAGWDTLALAVVAPIVLVVGLRAAEAAWPGPDPASQSFSALAGLGATNRWIMAGTLALVGLLLAIVALGLRPRVPTPAWTLLAAGGVLLAVAGVTPQPVGGYSAVHMVAAGLAWFAFSTWPLGLALAPTVAPALRRDSVTAFVVLAVLVAWFTVELVTSGELYGLSQRVLVVAQAVWPIRVAVAVLDHRAATPAERVRSG